MSKTKTAVVDDFDGFTAWLSTTPFVVWGAQKIGGQFLTDKPPKESPPKPDADLLAALKSMA